ncbi:MAG: 4,5-DOPA dioxygenase extradiol [Bdellovibrionales bacterium]|jgi:4,5-DOPA dioxygenase extradiol|nr:4,5-DOPA dioxygenase extradiol [Bdellovibrionales bacterium]
MKQYGKKQPVIFIGHGSPMNALADNAFTQTLVGLGQSIERPKAVLVISAHWLTAGTWVTSSSQPRTIHDFYGFPEELFNVQYPAPGAPTVAEEVRDLLGTKDRPRRTVHFDQGAWGLDHGTWSVLRHVFPDAGIPVLQLSIDMSEPPEFHLDLGRKLGKLREQGILIVGSGNIVHNLRQVKWSPGAAAYDWAIEFDEKVKSALEKGDSGALCGPLLQSAAGMMSVPTPDHYYPLLYVVGASEQDAKSGVKQEAPTFVYEGLELGAISMRTLVYGVT